MRTLKDKRADVAENLEKGGISPGGLQRPQAATNALKAYLAEIDKEIKKLSKMTDDAIIAKYAPTIPDDVKEEIRGTNFVRTLARGAYY